MIVKDDHVASSLHPEDAAATLILVHGRGASAESMMSLYEDLEVENLAALAPQGPGGTWYPNSFLAPLESNQPFLDTALSRLESLISDLLVRGIPSERIAILGFSQGACLTSEFMVRYPRRYGGGMILTGGVIGPEGTPRNYGGSLAGTPFFLGVSDPDPHVPFKRVQETKALLSLMGGVVELRRYPGMPHYVNSDELDACRFLLRGIIA